MAGAAPGLHPLHDCDSSPALVLSRVLVQLSSAERGVALPPQPWRVKLAWLSLSPLLRVRGRSHKKTPSTSHAWERLSRSWARQSSEVKQGGKVRTPALLDLEEVRKLVFSGETGILSQQAVEREASCMLAVVSLHQDPTSAAEHLLKDLQQLLQAEELNALSDFDREVYWTAPGELCTYGTEDVFKAVVVENQNVRRDRGTKGLYNAEEEKLIREAQREKAKKKERENRKKGGKQHGKGKGGKGGGRNAPKSAEQRAEEERAVLLEKQAAVRVRVQELAHTTLGGLLLLKRLALGAPDATRVLLSPALLAPLRRLLSHRVVSSLAVEVHQSLARGVEDRLKDHASLIERSTRQVVLKKVDFFTNPSSRIFAEHALRSVALELAGDKSFVLEPSSFLFLYPLIETAIMNSPPGTDFTPQPKRAPKKEGKKPAPLKTREEKGAGGSLPGTESAISILKRHCPTKKDPEGSPQLAGFPILAMSRLWLHVLAWLPAFRPAAATSLQSMAVVMDQASFLPLVSNAGVLSGVDLVRIASYRCWTRIPGLPQPLEPRLQALIWLGRHDESAGVKVAAKLAWQHYHGEVTPEMLDTLFELLAHTEPRIRGSAAEAIAGVTEELDEELEAVLTRVMALFEASKDEVVEEWGTGLQAVRAERKVIKRWPVRTGAALTLKALAPQLDDDEDLKNCFHFLIRCRNTHAHTHV